MIENENNFEQTEKIKVHSSWFLLFVRILIAITIINIFALIITLIFGFSWLLFIIRTIIELLVIIFLYVLWLSNHFRITPRKVIHKQGLIVTNQDSYNIESIDNISCNQNMFGRLFNYGDIILNFSGKQYILEDIWNPNYFSSLITRYNRDGTKK